MITLNYSMKWLLFRFKVGSSAVVRAFCFCLFVILHFSVGAQSKIEYYGSKTIGLQSVSIRSFLPEIKDTIDADTVYQMRAANDLPVSYYRKIQTSVCFDNKCRPLNIIVHWNVTGRYLGFELPAGEFLSKAEHEPFVFAEYQRMHDILSDPYSPLGRLEYTELVPVKNTDASEIDAVSSATASNLLEFVIEGAAFTTYKLWHIVYGQTSSEVSRITGQEMTEDLWLGIVKSQNTSDRVWALEQRSLVAGSSARMRDAILTSTMDIDYNVAESAIRSINESDLQKEDLLLSLLKLMDSVSHGLKGPILNKVAQTRELSPEMIKALGDKLSQTSADLVGAILRLLSNKQVQNKQINRQVALLLRSRNLFISKQAYEFLNNTVPEDSAVKKQINDYRRKHKLE